MGGLHKFMNWHRGMLTDSGGFQMGFLLKLAEITEEGVKFQSPHDGTEMLLTPELSMQVQNKLGADIMMALDDAVPATCNDPARVQEAMHRTLRWIDRCIIAHKRPTEQDLFGIVQGGLDAGLRKQCLDGLIARNLPGYAIGGLSGGEEESVPGAWSPSARPICRGSSRGTRNMGVGYGVDLVVCCALGVDMFDCVYPDALWRWHTTCLGMPVAQVRGDLPAHRARNSRVPGPAATPGHSPQSPPRNRSAASYSRTTTSPTRCS